MLAIKDSEKNEISKCYYYVEMLLNLENAWEKVCLLNMNRRAGPAICVDSSLIHKNNQDICYIY